MTKVRAMIIAAFILIFCIKTISQHYQEADYTETYEYVKQGDTLWDIATIYCPSNIDIRDYIANIKKDNHCTDIIKPGQRLVIRVYDEWGD